MGAKTRDWRGAAWRALEAPLTARILLVTYVVVSLYLALGLMRLTGAIPADLWDLLQRPLSEGAGNTFLFSATVIPVGLGIGFLAGWARVSRHPFLRWPATVYVDVIRGIPPLVMIFFAFFWLPFVFESTDTFSSGLTFAVLALALHSGAYQTEIFRAGFQSVSRVQIEAAESIGMTRWQAMRHVILPQTFRVTLPALGNEFATVVKDTSLLSAIGAADLVFWGRNAEQFAIGESFTWVFAIWIVIAVLYFVITYVITQIVAAVEQSYRVPGLGSVAF